MGVDPRGMSEARRARCALRSVIEANGGVCLEWSGGFAAAFTGPTWMREAVAAEDGWAAGRMGITRVRPRR